MIRGSFGGGGDFVPSSYLDTDGTLAANSDTKVPTQKAVKTAIDAIEPGGGSGDVVGPASAAADALALFNGTSGKLLKNGGTLAAALAALGVYPPVTAVLTAADLAVLHNTRYTLYASPGPTKIVAAEITGCDQDGGFSGSLGAGGTITAMFGDTAVIAANIINGNFGALKPWSASFAIACFETAIPDNADAIGAAIKLVAQANLQIPGGIATSELQAGGTGWQEADTFATAGGATFVVDTVNAGAIVTYHQTATGDPVCLVETVENVTATGGSVGVDASIFVLTLDYSVNPATLTVQVTPKIMETAP